MCWLIEQWLDIQSKREAIPLWRFPRSRFPHVGSLVTVPSWWFPCCGSFAVDSLKLRALAAIPWRWLPGGGPLVALLRCSFLACFIAMLGEKSLIASIVRRTVWNSNYSAAVFTILARPLRFTLLPFSSAYAADITPFDQFKKLTSFFSFSFHFFAFHHYIRKGTRMFFLISLSSLKLYCYFRRLSGTLWYFHGYLFFRDIFEDWKVALKLFWKLFNIVRDSLKLRGIFFAGVKNPL